MKVLSVDDSAIMRRIIKATIETLGFECLEACDGQDALNVLAANPDVSLILLDWNMPIMDGYTTLVNIRQTSGIQSIPVMMVTTESEKSNIIKALKAGANNYVTKPFSQEDLMTKVVECLGLAC